MAESTEQETRGAMQFTKMHGIGNDFVVVDAMRGAWPEESLPGLARRICDRHFGIGADGWILVMPSRVADFRMRIFNPDGSEAEMCGNGIRCFAKYVFERNLTPRKEIQVETLAGLMQPKLILHGGKVEKVRVDMGEPRLHRGDIPMRGEPTQSPVIREKLRIGGEKYEFTAVSMGNPHCVLFIRNVEQVDVATLGPQIEHHPLFPARTNVEFVQVLNHGELRIRVWERGAGPTIACGTGACAAVVAAVLNGLTQRRVVVHLEGGDLEIEWQGNNHVFMTGPAEEVFVGTLKIPLETG
jgi:diaminopimelate epimerase